MARVDVDGVQVWVSTKGESAKEMQKIGLGSTVQISGHLIDQKWPRERAGEGRKLVVRADAVELVQHPNRNGHVMGGDIP